MKKIPLKAKYIDFLFLRSIPTTGLKVRFKALFF